MNQPLFQALLLGNTASISPAEFYEFSRLGLGHLFSVSGFHMTLLEICILRSFCAIAQFGPTLIRHTLSLLKIAFFFLHLFLMWQLVKLSQGQIPALRALFASSIALLPFLWGINISPWLLFSLPLVFALGWGNGSFLSFALCASALMGMGMAKKPWEYVVWPWLSGNLIVVFYFHTFSLASPMANLILGPLISVFVLIPSFIALGVHSLGLTPWPLEIFLSYSCKITQDVVSELSQWKWALWSVSYERTWINLLILLPTYFLTTPKWRYFAFPFVCLILFLWPLFPRDVLFLDVGQGDATLLGEKILVDTGPAPWRGPYPGKIAGRLAGRALNQLDYVLITHPDWDHYGGLESILLRLQVKEILLPQAILTSPKRNRLFAIIERFDVPVKFLSHQHKISPELECWTLDWSRNSNGLSPLCLYRSRNQRVLLTGDLGKKEESRFIEWLGPQMRANILKVGHHGSRSSTSEDFLSVVQPNLAVISAANKNRYGHPHEEVLKRLRDRNIKIHQTKNGSLGL